MAFMCEHGTNNNTFRTRGELGNVIQATASGELKFSQVTNANADNQTATDRLTIDSSGQSTFTRDGLTIVGNRTGSDGDSIHVRKDNYTRLRLTTLGITFPNGGTAPVAGDANRLDYYEEGTWTPTLPNGGTLTVNSATYTRIGNICHLQFYVQSIAPTADTSQFRIGGMPFSVSDYTNYFAAGSIGYAGDGQFVNYRLIGNNNTTTCYFHSVAGTTTALSNNDFISQFSGSVDALVCSITYRVK